MLTAFSIAVAVLVAWRSFHFFFDDFQDFEECVDQAGRYSGFDCLLGYLFRKAGRQRAEVAYAWGRATLYFVLILASGLLAHYILSKAFVQ